MKKIKWLPVLPCILLSLCFPTQVRAEYYDNHVDGGDYCMQAKDVRITDTQRVTWMNDGILQKKILEMSGVFVNQFHPSDSTRYWTEYDGSYEVDTQALEELVMRGKNTSKTVPVVFYLNKGEGVFITIHVEVMASEQESPNQSSEAMPFGNLQDGKETSSAEELEQNTKNQQADLPEAGISHSDDRTLHRTQKEDRKFFIWMVMTILALIGYGSSLYSDFKVIKKYKKKLKERGRKE